MITSNILPEVHPDRLLMKSACITVGSCADGLMAAEELTKAG